MIERLVHALRALAAPPELQMARLGKLARSPRDIVLDFEDAFRLTLDCPQIHLERRQREALLQLERHLDGMSASRNAELWTERAVRGDAQWMSTRELAAQVLRLLGDGSHESWT